MSRKVRVSFAAPLVAIAVGPACILHTSSTPPPTGTGSTTTAPPPGDGDAPARPPILNPPRPTDPSTTPTQAEGAGTAGGAMQQTPPPVVQRPLGSWNLSMNQQDHTCYASVDVTCSPKATCNPPPPRKVACPSNMSMERGIRIVEEAPDACAVYYPTPACPPDMACNPPRPQKIDCPR